jgi:hypothetical protein
MYSQQNNKKEVKKIIVTKNEDILLVYATTWMTLKTIMLSEKDKI